MDPVGSVEGETPFYVTGGEGPSLVLVHSGGMAHQEWDVHRERLEQRFRVLALDLPGHGRSPLPDEGLTVAGLADAVEAVLDDAGVGSAHVVGSSMGGAAALHLALTRPQRVDRLVLFRIGHRASSQRVRDELGLADPERWRAIGLAEHLSSIHEPQGGPDAWKDVIERAANLPEQGTDSEDATEADLEHVEAPTLVVVGDRDPLVPLEEALTMYRAIPDADLWVIPRATHVAATKTWRRGHFEEEIVRFLLSKRPGDSPSRTR